jgi:EAL domain-containing protein (putative c-di-GMP-specific phosphodiesterase class I)
MADESTGKIKQILMAVFGGGAAPIEAGEGESEVTPEEADRLAQAMLSMRESLVSGQLKILDLGIVKAQFGPSWERKTDHVHMVCEMVLKRHLGHRHFYYRASDTAYVIVFDLNDKGTAAAACRAVSQEILTRLLGKEATNRQITVEVNLAEVFPEDVATGRRFTEVVSDRIDASQGERISHASQLPPPVASGPASAKAAGKVEPQFTPIRLAQGAAGASAKVDLQSLLDMSERNAGSWQAELSNRMGEQKKLVGTPSMTPIDLRKSLIGATSSGIEINGIDFSYSPIWSAPKKAVISHHLNIAVRDTDGRSIDASELMTGVDEVKLMRSIDRLVMKRGLADLARSVTANRKYIACIPVTSYSLMDQWGTPTLLESLLVGLPQPLPQLLVLDVVDAQALERKDLLRCANAAANKCKYLLLRASLDQTNFSALAHPMVRAIGGSLRDHAWSEKDASKKLESFVTSASTAKLETFIFGIHSRSLAFAAIAAGFDYLSGPAIAPDAADPTGVSPVDMLGLFG